VPGMARSSWPRIRLRLRAVFSSIMVFGWVVVAVTGFLLYFSPEGRRSGWTEILWLTKSEWKDVHFWVSVGIALVTIGHVVLNRKGLRRAFRTLAGLPSRNISRPGNDQPS
jgi:hypothetical protein